VARDLGLTSLQLENQRLAQALQAGGFEPQMANVETQRMQLLQGLNQAGFGRALAAGQYGESIRQPNVGLDPSSIANLKIGNSNANAASLANQANIQGGQSQNYMKMAGQGFGSLLSMNNQFGKQPVMNQNPITTYGSGGAPAGAGMPSIYPFGGL
jgi:hypothetical protein